MKLLEYINQGKTYIIAEMSANHAGSLENAKEIIYAAKEAGADCIKLQTYTADTITIDCDNKYFYIGNGTWEGENLYSLYRKAYTPWEWQPVLKELADKIGIDIFSTPFDKTSVDFLEETGMEFYKIASFELVDIPLIEYVAQKKKPIVMSTGMGSLEEITEAVEVVKKYGCWLALLKCSSAYPAVTDGMDLNTMLDIKKRFGYTVGLSDHSMGSLGAVAAVAMGASVIEKHFCLDRKVKSPDSVFSMESVEFKKMVQDVRAVEKAKGKVYYGPSEQEKDNVGFRKSIFVIKDVCEGEVLTDKNIKVIRPGHGIKPKYWEEVLGRKVNRPVKKGTPLSFDMLERTAL